MTTKDEKLTSLCKSYYGYVNKDFIKSIQKLYPAKASKPKQNNPPKQTVQVPPEWRAAFDGWVRRAERAELELEFQGAQTIFYKEAFYRLVDHLHIAPVGTEILKQLRDSKGRFIKQ